MNYRITLAYDGTDYFGWQLQLDHPTIQRVLNGVLEKLEGGPVITHAAGRTDTGVHAEGQVVSFRLSSDWDPANLARAINGNLPPAIRALEAAQAADDFHARFDSKSKTYRYTIDTAEVFNPLLYRYAWHYPFSLEPDRLRKEAECLIGTHDFSAFTVAGCEAKTRVRTITGMTIEKSGDLVNLFFTGEGFLRYQVRTMVSAIAESSRERLKAGSVANLLASLDRGLAGAPAPAKGLTLMKVEY